MDPRWKGKNFASIAEANPMSQIITQLQSSLSLSKSKGLIAGCSVLFEATPNLTNFLNHSCFGREITTCEKPNQWFEFSFEEAFYLHHKLQALTVATHDDHILSGTALWDFMRSKCPKFPKLYKAYSHLRDKRWVVRFGALYGGDFVAYRHHPALVHSEFVVIVKSEGDGDVSMDSRLMGWSDLQCSVRVCGSVAKRLLVLSVKGSESDESWPLCLEKFVVEENVVERLVPEQSRENNSREESSLVLS